MVEYTILKSDLGRASDNLHKLILSADTPLKIALARAVFLYKDTTYAIPQARQALAKDKRSTPAVLQSVQTDAMSYAKEVVSWDTANGKSHAARRKKYEEYLNLITNQFELFHKSYQKLAPSVPIPPFPKSLMTSDFLTMLRTQLLAWYDSKPSSKSIPDPDPQDGIARFMNEHRESLNLLITTHSVINNARYREMATKAYQLQLLLAPVLSLAIGLYRPWDGPTTFSFKLKTELERAILALSFFVPSFGRLFKSGRPVYRPNRLSQIYGGDSVLWAQATRYSNILSNRRDRQHSLDTLYNSIGPTTKLQGVDEAPATILSIVNAPSNHQSIFQIPEPEWWLIDLWIDLISNHHWLPAAELDEWAIRRALLMGPNLSQIHSQLLAELAETRIATFLRDKTGVYALGLADPPDGCSYEFVPGHAFRAGDKIPEFANRQISDGVIGYWDKDAFHIVAMLQAKVDGLGVRELGHAKTTKSSLSPEELVQLRRFAKRESAEDRDVAGRKEATFETPIDKYERQILQFETGSQIDRDIKRLDTLDQVRINGVLGKLYKSQDPSPPPIKIFAIVPKNTEPTALEKEIQTINANRGQPPFQFEALAVPPTLIQLITISQSILLKAQTLFPTTPDEWPNLDSEQVLTRIQQLVQSPYLFQQGNLGLCTVAAFLYHMFLLKPTQVAQFAKDLFFNGHGMLGKLNVKPSKDLRASDYQDIFSNKALVFIPDQTDWMVMCSLRDSTNWWVDFEGEPTNYDFADKTWTSTLAGWYRDTGFFSSVVYDSYWFTDPSADTIKKLVVDPDKKKNAVTWWIKTKMLRSDSLWGPGVSSLIFPSTHIIAVTGTPVVDEKMNKIEFEYWTWGERPRVLKEELDFVRDCIVGIIVSTI